MKEADLSLATLLHVAPVGAMTRNDLRLGKNPPDEEIEKGFTPIVDPDNLMSSDSRVQYWKRWCQIKGEEPHETPQAITDERMADLNAEPLLLHLLIISDYCGERWEEARQNRNLVYNDIFEKVFLRNKKKKLDAYKHLELGHFFELMEVFGLAAFRGNGRTGDHQDFETLRKLYAAPKTEREFYAKLDGASLKNVAVMVHSRREVDGAGFEFVHKSFGEYLAARGLIGAANRLQKRKNNDEMDDTGDDLALRWVNIIGAAEMSNPVLQFLRNEARLTNERVGHDIIAVLAEIFDHTLIHGFPAQLSDDLNKPSYRILEKRQKSAETCMLATLTNLWQASHHNLYPSKDGVETASPLPVWVLSKSQSAASDMIDRLFSRSESNIGIEAQLAGLNLSGADLRGADLSGAKLNRADLSGADLSGANLSEANLQWANLYEADLRGADLYEADLRGANLRGADLSEAKLYEADLRGANLSEANLRGADLSGADLREAKLSGAKLNRADLSGADLREVKLRSTNLSDCHMETTSLRLVDCTKVNLSPIQLNQSFGVRTGFGRTILPPDCTYPDHWHEAESAAEETDDLIDAYQSAYASWIDREKKRGQNEQKNKPITPRRSS